MLNTFDLVLFLLHLVGAPSAEGPLQGDNSHPTLFLLSVLESCMVYKYPRIGVDLFNFK